MINQIPHPGKKWSRKQIRKMANAFFAAIQSFDTKELRAIKKTATQLSTSNCAWYEFWMRDLIIKAATDKIKEDKKQKKQLSLNLKTPKL